MRLANSVLNDRSWTHARRVSASSPVYSPLRIHAGMRIVGYGNDKRESGSAGGKRYERVIL